MNKQQELLSKLNEKSSLKDIQTYIDKVLEIRGFNNEPAEKKLLLLTEEVGELAKAIRKGCMAIDKNKIKNYDSIPSEAADVFIVLCSLCNTLKIDLFESVKEKERENVNRIWQ